MTTKLEGDLRALPREVRDRLAEHHFDAEGLVRLSGRLTSAGATDNVVKGTLSAPAPGDVLDLPEAGSAKWKELREAGLAALSRGENALVVLAGGMATRMGGVVKALVPALPGRTFLELRLGEQRALEKLAGRRIPLFLMTSAATTGPIREALGDRLDPRFLATFPQRLSLRLTPEGDLFRDEQGNPSDYAPGHGDLPDAFRESGLLQRFLDAGGKTLTVANLDNLGATLDPVLIGLHLANRNKVTCEVVDKLAADRGGIPVRVDGRMTILEEFRIPPSFDPAQVRVFNTNTFHLDAPSLASLDMDWTYFVVNKKVAGRPVVQFERLINELAGHFETTYVRVPRTGEGSRFLPVKDHDELAARRPELELVARSRGMLG
jgi:UTP--glucose-1-phosphate uridylyltransferase